MAIKLSMPTSSWSVLKQIIRAYGQVGDAEKPTVDSIAEYAGLPRPTVSANNNFLRDIGIVSKEENKPTPLGAKLAATLAMENEALVTEALQELVRANPALNQWVGMVRARGSMKFDFLKGTIALAGGLTEKGKQTITGKAIIDLLQESKLIQINDDTIKAGSGDSSGTPEEPKPPSNEPERRSPARFYGGGGEEMSRIPLPLGPTRLAYVELPKDWTAKELPKLIKLLQIALEDDAEAKVN